MKQALIINFDRASSTKMLVQNARRYGDLLSILGPAFQCACAFCHRHSLSILPWPWLQSHALLFSSAGIFQECALPRAGGCLFLTAFRLSQHIYMPMGRRLCFSWFFIHYYLSKTFASSLFLPIIARSQTRRWSYMPLWIADTMTPDVDIERVWWSLAQSFCRKPSEPILIMY